MEFHLLPFTPHPLSTHPFPHLLPSPSYSHPHLPHPPYLTDGGGAVYQDPKDIQHTTVAGGETYAVADKKPKSVDHVASPAGDLYAVADNKQPKRKVTQPVC